MASTESNSPAGNNPPQDQADIESQLDSLLAEIKGGEAPASAHETAATTPAAPLAAETAAEATRHAITSSLRFSSNDPEQAADKMPSPAGDTGDELANQIQDLLDTAKVSAAVSAPAVQTAAVTPAPARVVSPQGETRRAAVAVIALGATKASIDHIDKLLAANADNAVAGDFETVAEVSGRPFPSEGRPGVEGGGQDAVPVAEESHEPALEGGFASPEELFEEPPPGPIVRIDGGADARAVAKELDEQPEHGAKHGKVPSSIDAPMARPGQHKKRAPLAGLTGLLLIVAVLAAIYFLKPWEKVQPGIFGQPLWIWSSAAGVALLAALVLLKLRASRRGQEKIQIKPRADRGSPLFRAMVAVNAPLLRMSAPTRNLIGWIGLLTLFNGSMLMMGRVVFQITGSSTPAHADAAEAGHGEADAHDGAKKADSGHAAKPKPKKAEAKKPAAKKAAKADHGGGH